MSAANAPVVRRIQVHEREPDVVDTADYSDSFELTVADSDARTPEELVRAGLEGAPAAFRFGIVAAHRRILGFRLGPLHSADHVLGWTIVSSDATVIHLRAESSLMRGAIVVRRVDPTTVRLATYLYFHRQRAAVNTWRLVGPIHRRVAAYLMRRAATLPIRA